MNTLSERLQHALATRDKSPAELARAVKKTESAVSQWLSGETKSLRSESLIAACAFLGCHPAWLYSGKLPSGLDKAEEKIEPVAAAIAPPVSKPLITASAIELAAIYDMIPIEHRLLRAEAFSLATTAIAEVLRRSQAIRRDPPESEKPNV
jgi:transcriptional regulator with XRE-family HTH domain